MKRIVHFVSLALVAAAIASLGATGSSGSGSIGLADSTPIVQDFNTLSNSATSNVLPPGWYLTEIGTGAAADGSYVVGTGSSNAGGAYSFGLTASANRALGSVGSGSVAAIHYGAKLTNTGSGPITALAISYDGEVWRRGQSTDNFDSLTFSYSTSATDLTTGTFTSVAALNFSSPGNACTSTAGAVNPLANATCRASIGATITGLAVNPGSSIWIRWTDVDTAGSDDGLALDNVSITATFSNAPTPPTAIAAALPNPVSPGAGITLSGSIMPGFNPLSANFTVTCDLSAIGGSNHQVLLNDGSTFSYTTTVSSLTPLGPAPIACAIVDDQLRSSSFSIPLTVLLSLNPSCGMPATPISTVQGTGVVSPLTGFTVDVEAVTVADFQNPGQLSGFYIEAPELEQDGNPTTSEGLFVFSQMPVAVGDRVRVRGTVSEFASNTGAAVSHLTELTGVSSVQVCTSGNSLPAAVDVALPIDDASHWEQYEGMLVRFTQQLVVTGNFSLGRFGQIDLAPRVLYQPTQQIGTTATWAAATDLVARSLISLDDDSTSADASINGGTVAPYPPPGLSDANTVRVGALVNSDGTSEPAPLVGILDDRFGAYRIQPTAPVSFSNAPNPRPDTAAVAAVAGSRFRIVSANVLNYFTTLGSRGAATPEELDHQRAKLVAELTKAAGDIVGLSELQNFANGQTNGGMYTDAAIADLTSALAAATGRNYHYIDTIDAAQLAAGNTVIDNGTDAIRSGLIYDASAVTPVGFAALYYQNDQNRPSLAQTFQPAGGVHPERQTFTVVVNHFRSKGSACGVGDDPYQGNCNGMRLSMANNVMTWLVGNPTQDPAGAARKLVVIGDFNAYFGEDPIQAFMGAGGYTNLINLLLGAGAYSYNFGSQAGYLDHAFANPAALPLVKAAVELHVNADEPSALEALGSNVKSPAAQIAYYAPNEFAASDHDPIVIGFNPLAGDFNDDGVLDATDRTALLGAIDRGDKPGVGIDRRMDMNRDGAITQDDFHIWQALFIDWKQGRK